MLKLLEIQNFEQVHHFLDDQGKRCEPHNCNANDLTLLTQVMVQSKQFPMQTLLMLLLRLRVASSFKSIP